MKTSIVRKQRGALGLMMAMIMLVLVLFAALAIDMARLTYQQQALQSVADIAALEVARDNPYYIDGDMDSIEGELIAKYKDEEGKVDTLEVQPGSAAIVDDYWTFFPNSTYSDERPYSAAQVKVEKTVPKSMIAGGALDDNTVKLTATAAIQKSGVVRLGIGSELISADLSIVDLSAVGYSGLVKSNIRLNDLIPFLPGIDLNALTPEEVLSTEISASDLLYAYADVLRLNHDEDGDISIFKSQLDDIADLVDGLSSIPNLTLGQLLELSSTQPFAALGANVNALDLVKATLYAANKVNSVSSPEININLPGVVNANSTLDLINAPQFKVALLPIKEGDEPTVSTEQVDLTANLSLLSGTLSSLEDTLDALPIISNPVEVEISPIVTHVTGAQATATLFNDDVDFNLRVNQSLGTVVIDDFVVTVTVKVTTIGINLVEIPIHFTIAQNNGNIASEQNDVMLGFNQMPFDEIFTPESNLVGVSFSVSDSEVDAGGGLIQLLESLDPLGLLGLVDSVLGTANALVFPLTNALISELPVLLSPIINDVIVQSLSDFGVNIGSTTVWVDAAGTTQYGIIK
ncbi:pilus assembly protein TadG-related protein [Vibrio casei]|uniref:pilus assembly protein TadG-related protein n=1 Tax=Vibrio casei TaxID=673372 RepID=UPI003F951F89